MNINSPKLDANINLASRLSNDPYITVCDLRICGGCGQGATRLVAGLYPRCQPCANKVVTVWNEMRIGKQSAFCSSK